MNDTDYLKTKLLSIDAWCCAEGWVWNNWRTLEEDICWDNTKPMTARRILKALRGWGYLTKESAGKLYIDDDGYNFTVCDRVTHEPLLAVCYGEYL